jgi:hypothetical protein
MGTGIPILLHVLVERSEIRPLADACPPFSVRAVGSARRVRCASRAGQEQRVLRFVYPFRRKWFLLHIW